MYMRHFFPIGGNHHKENKSTISFVPLQTIQGNNRDRGLTEKVWKSTDLKRKNKIRIFNTMVKPVLYYGAETWRPTGTNLKKKQTFVNSCLRKIVKIRRPDTISNLELWKQTSQIAVREEILQRKWRWLGHTFRKTTASVTRNPITWSPQGKRRRRRPKITWQRRVESEIREMNLSWRRLKLLAQDNDA
jgi:hypothetical protein